MCPAHIAFSTPKKLNFTWTDTFEDIKDAELKQLIIECRGALHSLEAELAARQNPRVDTKLEDCYARLQEKARTINTMGALSNKDRASLEEGGTFLEALKSGHIDSSQTRETRKGGAIYEQLLWLISRVAGPAYVLLLICSVTRRTVERLNSFQSAILVKRMVQCYDSLSSRALEEKANDLGLCKTSPDATLLLERASGKRKRGESDNAGRSIAWTNHELISHDESIPSNVGDKHREMEQAGATLFTSHHRGEVDVMSPPEPGFNSGILTPVSDANNKDDTNGNLALPRKVVSKRTCVVHPAAQNHSTSSTNMRPESDGTIDNSGRNKLAISNSHGSRNHNLYEHSYEFTGDSSHRREKDNSTLWKGLLPQSTRSKPITTPLNSSNCITAASVPQNLQLTSLAPGAQESFAVCPTQATLSIVNRVIGARTTRTDLRMIPVDRKSLVGSAGNVVSQPSRHVSNPGPQRQFQIQMKVSDTAQSISFAMKGDIDGLKYLFSKGLASPRDVSNSRGFSLVSWALYGGMCNYKTVQFLLGQGASVDEDSYQHAWDFAFRIKCSSTELNELKCITLNPPSTERDWIEEQQFPQIHNIIFGRSSKLLKAELDDNPDAVRVTDAKGRTALDWATARAQLFDMRLLIARGSSSNTMDVSGRTTVLHAVDSHDDDALRIVLEAGADPNPKVPKGLFRSSPLTAASFGGLVEMVKLLIEFGAKVNECNPEGRTALQAVASMQNVECADILLTYGADPDHTSKNGHSPFTTAIMCNNHAVLKIFLDRCHASRLKWPQLLPFIAEFADAETISILAALDLPPKRTPLDRDGFAVGRETLRSRKDYDEKLGDAFEELFSVATADKEAVTFRTPDGGIELGLSGSALVP